MHSTISQSKFCSSLRVCYSYTMSVRSRRRRSPQVKNSLVFTPPSPESLELLSRVGHFVKFYRTGPAIDALPLQKLDSSSDMESSVTSMHASIADSHSEFGDKKKLVVCKSAPETPVAPRRTLECITNRPGINNTTTNS